MVEVADGEVPTDGEGVAVVVEEDGVEVIEGDGVGVVEGPRVASYATTPTTIITITITTAAMYQLMLLFFGIFPVDITISPLTKRVEMFLNRCTTNLGLKLCDCQATVTNFKKEIPFGRNNCMRFVTEKELRLSRFFFLKRENIVYRRVDLKAYSAI